MKIMKLKVTPRFGLLMAALMTMIIPARSAVSVSDITDTEFNTLLTTYEAAWSVVYRGGGGVTEELRLARNTATPQVGGGSSTLIGQFTWSASNDMEISIDMAGNISARANSNTVGTWAITRPFNQVLIMLYDDHVLDAPSLTSIDVNGNQVRDLFADGFGYPGATDIVSVTGFGSQAPFVINSIWNPGDYPGNDMQYVHVVGLQNTAIPEPSSSVFLVGILLLSLRRRR